MNVKETIKKLEERLNDYISKISINILEHTPFIVEVGDLRVGTDENSVSILKIKITPRNFRKKIFKKINL